MKHFSHIYVEESVRTSAMTTEVLERFPRAQTVFIDDYRSFFNRPNQNFQLQKQAKRLILATKKDNLLYSGNDKVQSFGYHNFHYNTLLINCLYNCAYCYLQGMYQSANMVAFMNQEDFFDATLKQIQNRTHKAQPLYLAISYDTDLLASENILPYCKSWIAFARTQPELMIEIRTKSANHAALNKMEPSSNTILAWTLSPQAVIEQYEQGTPNEDRRIAAIEKALAAGWQVRLCFDPVIAIQDWEVVYTQFFERVFKRLPVDRIRDVSLGLFRINVDYFKRLKKNRPDTDLSYRTYERNNNILTLPKQLREDMTFRLATKLEQYIPKDRIELWT